MPYRLVTSLTNFRLANFRHAILFATIGLAKIGLAQIGPASAASFTTVVSEAGPTIVA